MSAARQSGQSPVRVRLESEDELLKRYASTRRPELEEEIVQRFLPLARSLAMRYRNASERNEDLVQVASLALVKALRRYDPERGNFAAYAAPSILGEIRRHFRDHSWRLHVPRGLQEQMMRVGNAISELTEEIGSSPSVEQIAERTGLDAETVLDVIQARDSQRPGSLDIPLSQGDEPDTATLADALGAEEAGFDKVEAQFAIERAANLTEREREVIHLRFAEGLSQSEIGDRIGVSQMQVSRDMRRGLARLLEAVQGDDDPDGRKTFAEDGAADPRFPDGKSRARSRRTEPTSG